MKYYDHDLKTLMKELNTSNDGLSFKEASSRLEKYGENAIKEAPPKSPFKIFISQFNDMMIIILIIVAIAMGIYGFMYSHEYTDTIVITVVVLLNAIMGFIQEAKAEVTLEGLKKYAQTSCKVIRDGKISVIDSKALVPGDIIVLEAGDKIPADARVIKETNVMVDESPLTGESVPVRKFVKTLKGELQIQDQVNMIFCGCNVTNGRVEALIVKTGMETELGLIAKSLNTPYEIKTPLELKIEELSRKLTILIFFILLFIFAYGLFNGYKVLEIVMLCVSLAVAAIPEGLPAVITITLSGGTAALARKKTIVRQMSAVETLGSTDIICSDKTGTITQNKMKVQKTIIEDEEMFKYVASLANETFKDHNRLVGDPTETCLFDYLEAEGIDPFKIRKEHPRIIDAPFDSERKMMSSMNEIDGANYCLVKGSLENLLDACSYRYINGKKQKMTAAIKKEIRKEEHKMAEEALRVIGFAYKKVTKKKITNLALEENDLIYIGMVGMIDPPRESVKDAVLKCKQGGIRPVMITGDSLVTACAIAKDVGIIENDSEGILGAELDKYSDEELVEVVKKYNVYARVSPEHKRRIVMAWQKNKKVVAMTGDGVNDAPAIKDAHVGVGMGITGTEVTKSVADIILLDDSFSTIVVAVEEGRRIFANIRNNIVYSLSSNFAEIFAVLIGMFTGNTIFIPIHILFIDLVTDSIPSICLAFEGSEKNIMKKQPRSIDKPLFTPFIYANIAFSAIVETIFVALTFFGALKYTTPEVASALALLSMVVQEICYAYTCRNLKTSIFKQGFFSNKYMNYGLLALLVVESLVFLTPVGTILSVPTLTAKVVGLVTLFNLLSFVVYEVGKPIITRLFAD